MENRYRLHSLLIASCMMVLFLFGNTQQSHAQGFLIPKQSNIRPLDILYQRVQVKLKDRGAQTTVSQVFVNHTNRLLEATYIFPLPKGPPSPILSCISMESPPKDKCWKEIALHPFTIPSSGACKIQVSWSTWEVIYSGPESTQFPERENKRSRSLSTKWCLTRQVYIALSTH